MNTGLLPLQVSSLFFGLLTKLTLSFVQQVGFHILTDFLSPVLYCSFDVIQALAA